MPGGPEINHLFFDYLQLKEKKITPLINVVNREENAT